MSFATILKANKIPIAIIGVLGSIAGTLISLWDLQSSVDEKKKAK